MTLATFLDTIQTNWSWAAGLAAAVMGFTGFLAIYLNKDKKTALANWLTGKTLEEHWATSFIAQFDAIFGARHWSWRCFFRSAIASLVAVTVIFTLMAIGDPEAQRLDGDLRLGEVLFLALFINILADYVSLLETRWLLGWLSKPRHIAIQVAVLVADFLLSAAIIWLAIRGAAVLPFIEADSIGETIGGFSVYSILFYSTFFTSVWTWAYIASTWILRLFKGGRLHEWLAVKEKPLGILGLTMAGMVFLGGMGVSTVFLADEDGVSGPDQVLCTFFKGEVCIHTMRLTEDEERRLEYLLLACEGGVTEECHQRAYRLLEITPEDAAELWEASCEGGDARGCTNLGYLHRHGLGRPVNFDEAARLYDQGCEGGEPRGCTNLGTLHDQGLGRPVNFDEAARLYAQGCVGDDPVGCSFLGIMLWSGDGMEINLPVALRLFQMACEMGEDRACGFAAEVQADIAAQ